MSHAGTNWAIQQRGLRPIAKLLLWHLADCHNPTQGCFPAQEYLADRCEISRSSVNRTLDELEAAGLIRREKRVHADTKRQMPTRYFLAFEEGFEPLDVVPRVAGSDTESRVSETDPSVCQNGPDPCPTADTPSEPVRRTGKQNQEKNAHERKGGEQPLAVVDGKVRLHCDDPLFRQIADLKRKHPPTDRNGYWTFPVDLVERAQASLSPSPASAEVN